MSFIKHYKLDEVCAKDTTHEASYKKHPLYEVASTMDFGFVFELMDKFTELEPFGKDAIVDAVKSYLTVDIDYLQLTELTLALHAKCHEHYRAYDSIDFIMLYMGLVLDIERIAASHLEEDEFDYFRKYHTIHAYK